MVSVPAGTLRLGSTEGDVAERPLRPVVVAAFVTHVPGWQLLSRGRAVTAVGLLGGTARLLADIVSSNRARTIVIALGSPYLILDYPLIATYICTYSLAPTAEIAAAKTLFGDIENGATLPVSLPKVAQRGSSIPWPRAKKQ